MSPEAVHAILADLERRAARVETRADGRESWRFRVDDAGLTYDLHFYPDDDTALKRYVGGAEAAREFAQLQTLQKLAIPATRVIANLKGLRLGERKGDACIVVHDHAATPLDVALRESAAWRAGERTAALASLIERLESLHREKLCPVPLVAPTFAQKAGVTLLADGSAMLRGIVDEQRLHELDASTRHVTRAAERLRLWKHFTDAPPPRRDRALQSFAQRLTRDAARGDGAFGTIEVGNLAGRFLRRAPLTLPWSMAAGLTFDRADWLAALESIESGDGESIKNDDSSRVVARTLAIGGRSLDVIIKRPIFKSGLRGFVQSLRRSRAERAWLKSWRMLALGFACEVPLVLLERRRALRTVEQLLIVERVPGPTLASIDLGAVAKLERERLFYSSGRVLRQIERAGFLHGDAKMSNWIIWTDVDGRLRPIMIDLDGIRFHRGRGIALPRLVRSLRDRADVTPDDLGALECGFRLINSRPR